MNETYTTFTLVSILPWCTVSCFQLLWLQIYHEYNKLKKIYFHIFQTTKAKTLATKDFGCKLFGAWAYLAPNLV